MLRRNIMVHLRQQELLDKGKKNRDLAKSMISEDLSIKPKSAANLGRANRARVNIK